ncbi:hypothetical protein KC353_g27 [Hortaea werneckii]|nr:hypothetical protein KC353_g27 [Hortaea werneckii]
MSVPSEFTTIRASAEGPGRFCRKSGHHSPFDHTARSVVLGHRLGIPAYTAIRLQSIRSRGYAESARCYDNRMDTPSKQIFVQADVLGVFTVNPRANTACAAFRIATGSRVVSFQKRRHHHVIGETFTTQTVSAVAAMLCRSCLAVRDRDSALARSEASLLNRPTKAILTSSEVPLRVALSLERARFLFPSRSPVLCAGDLFPHFQVRLLQRNQAELVGQGILSLAIPATSVIYCRDLSVQRPKFCMLLCMRHA